MTFDRKPCQVEGCRRTTGKPFREWVCRVHWSRLTRAERRVFYRAKRQAKRLGFWTDRAERIWRACKRRAAQ